MTSRLLLGVVIGLVAAAPAAAGEPTARTWQAESLGHFVQGGVTSVGPGRTVLVTAGRIPSEDRWATVARVRGADGQLAAQEIAEEAEQIGLDGSPAGGAALALHDAGAGIVTLRELLPGDDRFGPPAVLPGHFSGTPEVSVGDDGRAVVALTERTQGGGARVVTVSRGEPGGFGAPEPVTGWMEELTVTDAALAPDGTAVVGYVTEAGRFVAVRPPEGAWSTAGPLGGPVDPSWFHNLLAVGVDGRGAVVAAWTEGAAGNVRPLRVAFRAPGAVAFAAPRETGLTADAGKFGLGVSTAGEVVLLGGSEDGRGVWAAFGSTYGERLGEAGMLTGLATYAELGTNARGDATVVWNGVRAGELSSRTRRPGESFGPIADLRPGLDGGAMLDQVDVDPVGNAHALWRLNEGAGVAADGPLLTGAADPEPATGPLPPVLYMDPYEEAGIWMPGQPYDKYYPPYVPPSEPPPADAGAPSVQVGTLSPAPGARRLTVRLRCSERCHVLARAYRGTRAGKVARATLAARVQRRLRVALPRGRGGLRVRVSVRDAAGNARTVTHRVRTAR